MGGVQGSCISGGYALDKGNLNKISFCIFFSLLKNKIQLSKWKDLIGFIKKFMA